MVSSIVATSIKTGGGLERKRDSLLGNRRTGNSVLTQLWCTCGTCGMFALAPKPALASSARPSGPKHSDDPQPAPWWLVLPACWLRTVNFSRASLQGLRPVRTTDQAIERDHRCGVSCPGRASWPALHDHMPADLKIGAVKHARDCTKVASEPN